MLLRGTALRHDTRIAQSTNCVKRNETRTSVSTTIPVRNVSHGSATAETGMAERSADFLCLRNRLRTHPRVPPERIARMGAPLSV